MTETTYLPCSCPLLNAGATGVAPSGRRIRGIITLAALLLILATCIWIRVLGHPLRRLPELLGSVSLTNVRPIASVAEFDDVRFKDMSGIDLSKRLALPATLTFNRDTVWPGAGKMPAGCDPKAILAQAMNPGLGVRDLHRQGITGKGVSVGIIDQPLHDDHPEFQGKIAAYHDVGCGGEKSSMHGPAVASLLAGTQCGTAPGARLYHVAAPSWTGDTAYQAKALDWLIQQNEALPASQKIRVVSVSAAPSGKGSPFNKNQDQWDAACSRAEAKGIMVLDCTGHRGFIGPCYYDAADPEDPAKCKPGYPGHEGVFNRPLLVPASPRTTAEEYESGRYSYQYCGRGGLSWSIPYCAGVLALGWQVRPDLAPDQMKECLLKSAFAASDGTKIINPREFVRLVGQMPKAAEKLAD